MDKPYEFGISKYYNFYYMLTGKNKDHIRVYSLRTLVTIGLSIGLSPEYIYNELKELGYNITIASIKNESYERLPIESWISWIKIIDRGVVRSEYGLEEITEAMHMPVSLARLEYSARQCVTCNKIPVNDYHGGLMSSISLASALQNTSQSMPCVLSEPHHQ